MFQRAQIPRRRRTAAHQQNVPQADAPAALGAVVPPAEQPFRQHGSGADDVKQAQHHAGVVVLMEHIQPGDEHQHPRAVHRRDGGAAAAESVQAGGVVHAAHPVAHHQTDHQHAAGQPVEGVPRHLQRGTGAARLKKAYKVETQVVCQTKGRKQQNRVQQHIHAGFDLSVFIQQCLRLPSYR